MAKAYNVKNIAQILCISERRVRQLANDGVIPEVSDGWFMLLPSVQGYIKYLQGGNSDEAHRRDKAELIRLKAQHEWLVIQEKRGELHSARDVELFVTNMIVAFRTKLLTMPHGVLPQLLAVQQSSDYADCVIEILRQEVEKTLNELSELSVEKIGEDYEQEHDEAV